MNTLALRRNKPYQVSTYIKVNNPTLGQIEEYGEERYWGIVSAFCSTSYDYRLTLEEAGVDYLDIDDWHMFLNTRLNLPYEETQILIPDIDFTTLIAAQDNNSKQIVLLNDEYDLVMNEAIYMLMVDYIRECHGLTRNFEIPGNNAARMVFMQEAREARQMAGRKKFQSTLDPLISGLCNHQGFKYDFDSVWNLNIYNFMDSVKRIQKINSADHFLAGMYSGMMDVSKMGKGQIRKETDWLGELK